MAHKEPEKKNKIISIRITEEVARLIEYNAREERRKPAEVAALWVEDVARAETLKKCDKGAKWSRPQYAPSINAPEFDTLAKLIESEKGEGKK